MMQVSFCHAAGAAAHAASAALACIAAPIGISGRHAPLSAPAVPSA